MNLQIGKAIYNILIHDEDIHELIGEKIYPLVADNGTSFPFIVYKRNSINPANSKDKFIYQESALMEVVIASDRYEESINIAEKVSKALQGKKGIFNGITIQNIENIDAVEDFIEDTYIQTITIKIFITNG